MEFKDIKLKQETLRDLIDTELLRKAKNNKKIMRFVAQDGFDRSVTYSEVESLILNLYKNANTPRSLASELQNTDMGDCFLYEALISGTLTSSGYKPTKHMRSVFMDLLKKNIKATYFVACENEGLIKIGKTKHLKTRVSSLSTSSPSKLTLCFAVLYRDDLEAVLHKKFESIRSHGEWFFAEESLLNFIRDSKTKGLSYLVSNAYPMN